MLLHFSVYVNYLRNNMYAVKKVMLSYVYNIC